MVSQERVDSPVQVRFSGEGRVPGSGQLSSCRGTFPLSVVIHVAHFAFSTLEILHIDISLYLLCSIFSFRQNSQSCPLLGTCGIYFR